MAYDGRVMRLALERFDEDRRARSEEQERRRERVFARQPGLREIEGELRSTMSRIIAQALRQGTDPVPAVERLRDENLRLQEEKRTLLRQMGLPEDYLEEQPVCPICNDTGYDAGGVCRCLRAYYAKEQQKELSRMLDLGNQSFDTFELEWYSDQVDPAKGISPQENMKWVYDVCAEYAHWFGRKPGNLLLFGAPGLGKTICRRPLPGRSAAGATPWCTIPLPISLSGLNPRSSAGRMKPRRMWSGCWSATS